MVIAAFRGETSYDLLLLLHVITVLVAFAPAVVHPIMGAQYGADGPQAGGRFMELAHRNGQRIYLPALVAVGLTGLALVLVSDGAWSFGDAWISLAFLAWLAIGGVITAVMLPAEKKVAGGDPAGLRQVTMAGQIATLLLLVVLYLMIFKPGA